MLFKNYKTCLILNINKILAHIYKNRDEINMIFLVIKKGGGELPLKLNYP